MTTTIQSSITFDRDTRDFEVTVDLQVVGWRGTRAEAEALLNETVTRITALRAQADTPACRTCGGPVEVDASVGLFDDECDACGGLCCEACGASVDAESAHLLGDRMVCAACAAHQAEHVAYMAALAAADDERRAAHEASLVAEYEAQLDEIVAADQRCAGCGDALNAADALTLAGLPVCASCHHSLEYSALRGVDASDQRRAYRELLAQVGAIADRWRDNDPPRTEAAEDRHNRGGW
jgi:hypothetical protein